MFTFYIKYQFTPAYIYLRLCVLKTLRLCVFA